MIGQNSNNRASGITAKDCDAGIPISGRTSGTGTYQILKVNADGSLPGGETPLPDATTSYMAQAQPIAVPPGAFAATTFLDVTQITAVVIDAGLYRINPFYMFPGAPGGSINLALARGGSTLLNYANTLTPYVDPFIPTTNDFFNGLAGFWHNNAVQVVGGSANTPYNRSNALNVYLDTGSYAMIAWVDTGITSIGGTGYCGVIEFTKIG